MGDPLEEVRGHYVQDWENYKRGVFSNARKVLFSLTRRHFREYLRLLSTTLHTAVIG